MDDNAQPATQDQADRLISHIEKQVIRPQIGGGGLCRQLLGELTSDRS
ncbi:MAG: hypothetical protein KDB63_02425 [Nocardioidaceae bacterium]|nr:hypothetical protein [Nocardioidaceae bacterium]